jgi:hypothetical protein
MPQRRENMTQTTTQTTTIENLGNSYYRVYINNHDVGDVWKTGSQWVGHPSVDGAPRPVSSRVHAKTRSAAIVEITKNR